MSSSIKERSAFCITTTCYSLLVVDPGLEGGAPIEYTMSAGLCGSSAFPQ
jgi:hypothetical protein